MVAESDPLSRRERQVMDIAWRLESATAGQIREALPDPPSYSAVRALLATLVRKGHLSHQRKGRAYVYRPTAEPAAARQSALRRVVDAFFAGSSAAAAVALLNMDEGVSPEARARIEALVDEARKDGR